MTALQNKHIMVGMSGGVDSSVAALLLHEQGYRVSGLFMKNWEDDDPEYPCTAKEDAIDAFAVCDRIGVPFDAIEFVHAYRDRVFSYFLAEYEKGRTPNPDVLCNKEIKFRAFLDYALQQGASKIATGHYARVVRNGGRHQLLRAADDNKDQTYFLHQLNQEQLARTEFPLGELTKPQVRRIAADKGFANHAKKDSTGICFIGERQFKRFLSRHLSAQPGEMRSPDGELLGRHDGLMFYTLGQRQGLGIGGRANSGDEPWYVVGKDLASNTLLVAQGAHHPLLYSDWLEADTLHWIDGEAPAMPLRCTAKTRYRQPDQACTVARSDAGYRISFDQPQRAVTPGQSVVLYQGEQCLGGGIIERAGKSGSA